MIRLTQTDVEYGNCWQTAIACILEIDPATMPDQAAIVAAGTGAHHGYHNPLMEYLVRHHRMAYYELQDWQFGAIKIAALDGYHMLVGPTVRTPMTGVHHVVVAQRGKMVWDVHPSRAGLTQAERWGILSPVPERFVLQREESRARMPDTFRCLCPECDE